jgi:hypothetical protein
MDQKGAGIWAKRAYSRSIENPTDSWYLPAINRINSINFTNRGVQDA